MGILLEILFEIITVIPFTKAREEDIEGNMHQLQKQTWFQDFLKDDTYKDSKKLAKESYLRKAEERVYRLLVKRAS